VERYVRGEMPDRSLQNVPEEEAQSSGTEPRRFCRKCFMAEMKRQGISEETYRSMLERIEMMDPSVRCTKEVYEARLAECKKCEYLMEAMCGLCGCFAESRAAVKANACPAKPKRWEAEVIESDII